MMDPVAHDLAVRPGPRRARLAVALTWVALAAALAGGCARRTLPLRPTSALALPVTFTYGSLRPDLATFREARDPRTGYSLKRAIIPGRGEVAVVDVIALAPPYVFERDTPRSHVSGMLNGKGSLSWGDAGVVREGPQPVAWQKFQRSDPPSSCLAILRPLRETQDDTRTLPSSQEVAAALYCRSGTTPLPDAEVPAIARALRLLG